MDGFAHAPAGASKAPAGVVAASLAGLQGGMLGALWMLAWMGVSARWEQRSFWTPENLFATAFYGGSAIAPGFTRATIPGLALYLLLYSLLGATFAAIVRDHLTRTKVLLAAVLLSAVWYVLTFRLLWKTMLPLASLLHSQNPTFLGHLIYGTFLGRFQIYLEQPRSTAPAHGAAELPEAQFTPITASVEGADSPATPAPTQSSSPPDPV